MKKIITSFLLLLLLNANAQIGGGWDWAFNTGSFGGTIFKHLKYTQDGSEILMAGQALGAAYFGATTLTATDQAGYPGNIKFFGKINATTNAQTILRSFINIPVNFDCITTDDAGNFYIGGAFVSVTDFDFGNGVTIPGSAFKMNIIAKFDALGNTLWAKTFQMGATGSANNNVIKLAVSNAGNVFFWGFNPNADANGKRNAPLYKLDNNGNTIWFKDALNNSGVVGNVNNELYLSDKFIDNNENIYLFVSTASVSGFTFNGISYPTTNASAGSSTLIKLNSSGDVSIGQTFQGGVTHFQVNRLSGNLIFSWDQFNANPGAFQSLPHPFGTLSPSYANAFTGMMEVDSNLNFVKAKDYSTILDNSFQITGGGNRFLSLPNGKLLIATKFYKTASYTAGVNSLYPADNTKYASAIVETDVNWGLDKFIFGGKAADATQDYLIAYNDTYLIASGFYAEEPGYFTSNPPLPTTSFGTVNLTGFNAAPNFTSAYIFSNNSSFRFDVALAQCKSANFPTIASTTWLGNTNNWNTPSNWSNGVPTNAMKAIFNAPTAFYPTVSTTPTAATLEVNSGVTLPLPTTIALVGGLKNEGTIILNDVGFFQGLGSNEWKGSGNLNFTGNSVNYFYGRTFTNSLILNTNLATNYNMTIPSITFNSGKMNMNSKKITITNSNPNAISGTNATSYFYGGTLERNINATGLYEFPVGSFNDFQSASINATNLTNVNSLKTTFTSGAITGTTPNVTIGGATVSSSLNAGWYSIIANSQPSSGTYDITLNLKNSSNTVTSAAQYAIIKRDNASSVWATQGNYSLATQNAATISASNTNLTSFSDFAIGIANQDVVLSADSFENNSASIFPNPALSNINLKFSKPFDNGNLKIISIAGQTVLEKQNISGTDFNCDVSHLNNGIYILQLSDENTSFNSKFIKQ